MKMNQAEYESLLDCLDVAVLVLSGDLPENPEIIYNNASFSYRTRPFTSFQIQYKLDYARGTSTTITDTGIANAYLPAFLKRDFGSVYTLTEDDAIAHSYLNFLKHQYQYGLGVVKLKVNILNYIPVMGDTVYIDSESMKLQGHYIISGILYDLDDLTYTLTLITI